MNPPYHEPGPFNHAADQLPAPAQAGRCEQPDRGFWTDPYRDGHPIEAEQRERNRVCVRQHDELSCSLGRVIDLSTRGCRVSRRSAMTPGGEIFSFTLRSGRDELTLRGACVWSRKAGFMRHTAGIALAGMSAEETRLLRAFIDRHASGPVISAA